MGNPGSISALLDMVSDAIVLVDDHRRISYMNPEAERLTGCSSGRALGTDLWEVCRLVHRNTRKPVTDDMEQVLRRDGCFHLPGATVLVPEKGDDVLVGGTVFRSHGSGVDQKGIQGFVFRDVSAGWLLDPVLRNSQRSDSIRVLAMGIVGNVNDMLTVLLARISGISREHGDRSAVLRHVRESRKLIGRISGMLASLTADPVPHGSSDLCSTGSVIRACSDKFLSMFEGVRLELAYPDRTGFAGLPGGLLEQVLLNLLTNAGRAAGEGGRVVLTACRAVLPTDTPPIPPGVYVLLTVSDDGPGIPSDELTRIFNPFFSTYRNRYGLGLSAVYSIINGSGGYVTVDSKLGSGSTFSVYIPSAPELENETGEDSVPVVMVMGLDDDTRSTLEGFLEAVGCELHEGSAGNGTPARNHEDGSRSCRIVLTDYEHYLSEKEVLEASGPAADGFIILVDESLRSPSEQSDNVVLVNHPANLDKVASAVARLAWSRKVPGIAGPVK
jgi:PAS domain S-box-containing protein